MPLKTLIDKFRVSPKKKKVLKPKVLQRHYREIDIKMQSVIVICRYGQLKDFSLPLNSIYTVS